MYIYPNINICFTEFIWKNSYLNEGGLGGFGLDEDDFDLL